MQPEVTERNGSIPQAALKRNNFYLTLDHTGSCLHYDRITPPASRRVKDPVATQIVIVTGVEQQSLMGLTSKLRLKTFLV